MPECSTVIFFIEAVMFNYSELLLRNNKSVQFEDFEVSYKNWFKCICD